MGIQDIGEFLPFLLNCLKVIGVGLLATPVLAWPLASRARRRAYGPGGGRK